MACSMFLFVHLLAWAGICIYYTGNFKAWVGVSAAAAAASNSLQVLDILFL